MYPINNHFTATLGASYSLLPIRGKVNITSIARAQYNNLVTLSIDYAF